jgi:predicted DNA-binding transcriptional regulator YafY
MRLTGERQSQLTLHRAIELGLLLEREPTLKLPAAAQRLGISVGWARRLRAILETELGVLLQYHQAKGVWQVIRRGQLPYVHVTAEDVEALMITLDEIRVRTDGLLAPRALDAVRRLGLEVLGDAYGEVTRRYLRAGAGAFHETEGETYQVLRQAVARRQRVRVNYDSAHSQQVEAFFADPQALFFAETALYVDVVVQPQEEERMLRVQRISRIRSHGQAPAYPAYDFARRRRFMFRAYGPKLKQTEPIAVTLELTGSAARFVGEVHWHETQEVVRMKDGRLRISFTVWNPDEVIWWSARWGAECRVIEPAAVVTSARRWWSEAARAQGVLDVQG